VMGGYRISSLLEILKKLERDKAEVLRRPPSNWRILHLGEIEKRMERVRKMLYRE